MSGRPASALVEEAQSLLDSTPLEDTFALIQAVNWRDSLRRFAEVTSPWDS